MRAFFQANIPAVVLILLLLPWSVDAAPTAPITIGVISPLSGDMALYGTCMKKAIELASNDLRAGHGFGGREFSVVFEDDQCDAAKAVTAYQKLRNVNKADVILGPACSSAAAALTPLAAKDRIPIFYFAEGATIPNVDGYAFRLWVPNSRQGEQLGEYAAKRFSKLAVLAVDNAYGVTLADSFLNAISQNGKKAVSRETYLSSQTDYRADALKALTGKPDAIFVAGYVRDSAALVFNLRQLGFKGTLLGSSNADTADFINQASSRADGMIISSLPDTSVLSFKERWVKEFQEPWPGMQIGASLLYDAMTIVSEATNIADRSGIELKEAVRRVDGKAMVSGPLSFDSNGDLTLKYELFQLRGGKFQPLGDTK